MYVQFSFYPILVLDVDRKENRMRKHERRNWLSWSKKQEFATTQWWTRPPSLTLLPHSSPKRQSFKFSWLGHHLRAHIAPLFLKLGVILPLPENYEGLLCSGRNFYHLYKSKAMTFNALWPRKSFGFSKRKMQLCYSFFTAVMFRGNLTVMSFPCFRIVLS